MRPTHLELEGFASFRDPVAIDFDDADLFVLAGPTGSGKSSVVDAMIMALYGTVPRYDDRRVVAPVISQGRTEARIRLDFSVAGTPYTAVRVVRRTKTGATTKEARLERWRDPEGQDRLTLAGTADEVSAQVERLLGLRFEHFTSCIVLPQGAFQHFLHARPKDRQDLLVQLLDLDVYRRVGQAARDRATASQQQVELYQRRLDGELATATADEVRRTADRVTELEALLGRLDDAQPHLDEIQQQGTRLRQDATRARERARLLSDVRPPDDLDEVVTGLRTAHEQVTTADTALEAAGQRVEAATAERQQAGDATPLDRQLQRLEDRADVAERLGRAERNVEATTTQLKRADEDLAAAERVVEDRHAARQTAQHRDLVAAVVADHDVGDPCPVCDHPLEQLPRTEGSADLERAEADLADAQRAREAAAQARTDAEREATRAQADRDGQQERARQLDAQIATAGDDGVPVTIDEVRQQLARLRELDAAVTEARSDEQQARAARRTAQQDLDRWRDRHRRVEQAFAETCDRLAELRPPAADRDDLGAAWDRLVTWAAERRPQLLAEAEDAERRVDDAARQWRDEAARLRDDCVEHGVTVDPDERPRDAAVRDLERTRARHDRLREQREEAERLEREVQAVRRDHRVATALGQHLRSSNFEKWLLNRALRLLVRGATSTLHELSGGAYSLTLDDAGGFAVVDHRNADEVRSARTLSGGETFLASLALALALSEHVADLAAQGAARLESLILDEGFGTLDAETLDVVATALEELGSRGRMIGVITHVEALAERLPVRFAVRKEAGTSHVERLPA